MDYPIILHPDIQALMEQILHLKTKLAQLIEKKDHLIYQEAPVIEATYMKQFGKLQIEMQELDLKMRKNRRKITLIQKKINRRESLDMEEIEEILENELSEYSESLQQLLESYKEANALLRSVKPLSKEDSKELKHLYQELVKKLHPDLNPNLSEKQMDLLHSVMNAYELGDLSALKSLYASLPEENPGKEPINLESLLSQKEKLQQLKMEISNEIEQLAESYPIYLKQYLAQPDLNQHTLWLQNNIETLNQMNIDLEEQIHYLIKDHEQSQKILH